jgi:hypothetical protein
MLVIKRFAGNGKDLGNTPVKLELSRTFMLFFRLYVDSELIYDCSINPSPNGKSSPC